MAPQQRRPTFWNVPAPVFPDEPFFAHDPDLCHYLERWPELLRVADARLMETVARIDSLTLDEVRAFPERTSRDWPNLTEVGIEPLDRGRPPVTSSPRF